MYLPDSNLCLSRITSCTSLGYALVVSVPFGESHSVTLRDNRFAENSILFHSFTPLGFVTSICLNYVLFRIQVKQLTRSTKDVIKRFHAFFFPLSTDHTQNNRKYQYIFNFTLSSQGLTYVGSISIHFVPRYISCLPAVTSSLLASCQCRHLTTGFLSFFLSNLFHDYALGCTCFCFLSNFFFFKFNSSFSLSPVPLVTSNWKTCKPTQFILLLNIIYIVILLTCDRENEDFCI